MTEPLRLDKNPYAGINPHLQSWLQTPGSWRSTSDFPSFHSDFLTTTTFALNRILPKPYLARTEKSLQIRASDPQQPIVRRPQPDITIYGREPIGASSSLPRSTNRIDLLETLDPESDFVRAVVIRTLNETTLAYGDVVARIELLSPSNMYGQSDYGIYRDNRLVALQSGVALIEINLLHEFIPPLLHMPRYGDEGVKPYAVYISDPRPTIAEGSVETYPWDFEEIALIPLPLLNDDRIECDFHAIYQANFEGGRWGQVLDYRQPPLRFETYTPRDQAVIQAKMAEIIAREAQT